MQHYQPLTISQTYEVTDNAIVVVWNSLKSHNVPLSCTILQDFTERLPDQKITQAGRQSHRQADLLSDDASWSCTLSSPANEWLLNTSAAPFQV